MEEREIYSYRSKFTEKKAATDVEATEYESIDEYLDSLVNSKQDAPKKTNRS